MIGENIIKRFLTSIILITLLILMYFYLYILIISLIIISIITWIEFYGLISKIFNKNIYEHKIKKFFFKTISLLYLFIISCLIITAKINEPIMMKAILYSLLVSVMSDIGGIIIGKTFKGKKLTKISPNKTISGSIGSFIFALLLVPIFLPYFSNYELTYLIIITLLISFISQSGDLLISYVKRKAKVKDTSDILPGHGGFLDRIDGIIFSIPAGYLLLNLL